jgi:hypothetical protein
MGARKAFVRKANGRQWLGLRHRGLIWETPIGTYRHTASIRDRGRAEEGRAEEGRADEDPPGSSSSRPRRIVRIRKPPESSARSRAPWPWAPFAARRRPGLAGGLVVGQAQKVGHVAAVGPQGLVDRLLERGVVPAAVEALPDECRRDARPRWSGRDRAARSREADYTVLMSS